MSNKITYTDKEYLINDTTVPDKNKVLDTDMNEIKSVVNSNADELDTATNNIETNTQDISSIKSEQETQNENIQTNTDNISALSDRVSTNENDISDIKTDFNTLENTVIGQAQEIAENTSDIVVLKGKVETNETDIANIKQEQTTQNTNITNLQNNKVDKVAGKGLSTNDFTDEYKEQVDTNAEDISNIQTEQTTQNEEILALQAENTKLKQQIAQDRATYPTTGEVTGQNITLDKTAEMEFIQPPLPRGNSEQVQYSGKNKLNVATFEKGRLDNGVRDYASGTDSITYTNNSITITTNAGYRGATSDYIEVDENTNYIYSQKETISGYAIRIACYDSSKTFIADRSTANFTTPADTKYIRLCYLINVASTVTITNPMLRLASITDDTYEPYVGGTASPNPSYPQAITNVTGDVEVLVQNKNLFLFEDLQQKVTAFNITGTKDNFIIARKSTNTYNYLLNLKSGKSYTFSGKWKTAYGNGALSVIYTDGTSAGYLATNYSTSSANGNISLTTNSSKTISHIKIELFSGGNFTIDDFMIEENTTATPYTPHKEQVKTFPLGTQRMYLGDYLADDGIHHVRKQVVFNGSEDGWASGTESGLNRFTIPIREMKSGNNSAGLCNYFTNTHYIYTEGRIRFGWGNNRLYFYVNSTDFPTLADFKTWLSTHNVTVEYELAEEEITPYTTEQQQAYDEIKQAISYEEQTNISGSSDESNPLFSVEAYQSTKLVLQEISNAIVALGGV